MDTAIQLCKDAIAVNEEDDGAYQLLCRLLMDCDKFDDGKPGRPKTRTLDVGRYCVTLCMVLLI